MKTMRRSIIALCMVITILISSSSVCFAVVCPNAPDGVHHFNTHHAYEGTNENYTHLYLFGYDNNNNPIYYNCYVTKTTSYCYYVCSYCGLQQPNVSSHTHVSEIHSASH